MMKFKVRRISMSQKTGHTYLCLEQDEKIVGKLDLNKRYEELINAKEVEINGK